MNFLQAYEELTKWPANEAPSEYHNWAAFSVLSACAGPNLWCDMGIIGNIQPNIYVMLVGPPGIKKSTAKDIAEGLIRKIHSTKHPIPLAPANCTKEALVKYMADSKSPCRCAYEWQGKARPYTRISFFTDEFINLVQTGGDPLGWVQFFTEIYNPKPVFDTATIARGAVDLPFPYVTFLGCMTPELTKSLINEGALSGGFSRRTIYIYANKNDKPVPIPVITEAQKAAREVLIQRGQQIQNLSGRFQFSDAGLRAYTQWYGKNFEEINSSPTAAVVNFLQSKPTLAIKLAMLARLSYSDELIIDEDDFELAEGLLTVSQRHIDTIFAGAGRNKHAATIAGIQQFVNAACSRPPYCIITKKVHAHFLAHASVQEIDDILDQMQKVDQIVKVQIKLPGNNGFVNAVTSKEFHDAYEQNRAKKDQ